MGWKDVIKLYSGRSNMAKAKKVEATLRTMLNALEAGEIDETIRFAKNETNFKYDNPQNIEPLQLSKEELVDALKALLIGVDGLIDNAADEMMEDAGDRAFVSQFER